MRTRSSALSPLVALPGLLLLYLWQVGCVGQPLDYQTALNLLKERKSAPIRITFSAILRLGEADPKVKEAYDQLIAGHVLDCKPNAAIGTLCEPGVAGDAITPVGSTDLSLIAGEWVPSVVTSITRSGTSTSTAEARLAFEPSALYKEYQQSFDTLENSSDQRGNLAQIKDGKSVQATFQRTEEGWRMETLQ